MIRLFCKRHPGYGGNRRKQTPCLACEALRVIARLFTTPGVIEQEYGSLHAPRVCIGKLS
jgi:hypothetical protein